MALRPGTRYSGQTETGDPAYPLGKARNAGAFNDGTGTPLEKDWLNDDWGFKQALLAAAEIDASGDPDEVGASQYLDALRAVAGSATSARHLRSLMQARALTLGSTPPTDDFMAAHSTGALGSSLLVKGGTGGVFQVNDTSVGGSGVNAQISDCRALAYNGTNRFIAVGNGGTSGNAFSTSGSSWTAGGAFGGGFAVPNLIVWDGTEFIVLAGGNSRHSTNGVAWTAPSGNDFDDATGTSAQGVALLSPGVVLAIGPGGVIGKTTNHGATWTNEAAVPTLISNPAFTGIVGYGTGEVLAFIKDGFGSIVECWTSTDAITWTKRSEHGGHDDGTLNFAARMCQDTGLVVVSSGDNPARVAASIDFGRTWSPLAYYGVATKTIAVARGRIFGASGTRIFATDPLTV